MKALLSVIVAVYNIEKYLPECIESILSQDYSSLELILVDDGSKDSSGEICDRYAAADHRIRVIHQENGGAAAAKNSGLRKATGEYLTFVDGDDYLDPDVYGYMMDVLKKSEADAAQFGFRYVFPTKTEDYPIVSGRTVVSGRDYLVRFLNDWTCAICVNKIYKRALFDGVFFEEGHRIDDEYFTYKGFMNADSVVCDDRIVYNYRQRGSSAMLSPASQSQLALDRIDCISKRRKTVASRVPELRKTFDVGFLDALVYISEYPDNTPESIRLLKKELKAYMLEAGNTFPPKYLWKGLLRLGFTPEKQLLEKHQSQKKNVDSSHYFE